MNLDDVNQLPPVLDTYQVAELWRTTPDALWALVRQGRSPVPVLHLGRSIRWPTRLVLAAIGLDEDGAQ